MCSTQARNADLMKMAPKDLPREQEEAVGKILHR